MLSCFSCEMLCEVFVQVAMCEGSPEMVEGWVVGMEADLGAGWVEERVVMGRVVGKVGMVEEDSEVKAGEGRVGVGMVMGVEKEVKAMEGVGGKEVADWGVVGLGEGLVTVEVGEREVEVEVGREAEVREREVVG